MADLAAMLSAMGAVVRGAGTSRIEIEGVDELRPDAPHGRARPGGGGDLPGGGRDGRRRGDDRGRPARAHGDAAAQGRPDGRATPRWARTGCGPARTERLVSADVATLPYPGVATDYKPAAGGHAHRGRRRGHPHREPLLGPVPLRRGAAADGRRHPDRGPPCRRARGAAGSRARRCGPPTSGPGWRWSWPGWWPRGRRW